MEIGGELLFYVPNTVGVVKAEFVRWATSRPYTVTLEELTCRNTRKANIYLQIYEVFQHAPDRAGLYSSIIITTRGLEEKDYVFRDQVDVPKGSPSKGVIYHERSNIPRIIGLRFNGSKFTGFDVWLQLDGFKRDKSHAAVAFKAHDGVESLKVQRASITNGSSSHRQLWGNVDRMSSAVEKDIIRSASIRPHPPEISEEYTICEGFKVEIKWMISQRRLCTKTFRGLLT